MAASHLFLNKKNSKDHQHMNFGKHTGAGPWWALPWTLRWALPWALGPPLGPPLGPGGALWGSGPAGPWALVGPQWGPAGIVPSPGPSPGLSGAPAGIGPCRGPNKYVKSTISNV